MACNLKYFTANWSLLFWKKHNENLCQVIANLNILLEILFKILPKHGKKLGQRVASIRWWNRLPIFCSRFHHSMIKQISIVETRWNRVPNIGRLLHHLTESTFWPSSFLPCFGEMLNKIFNSIRQPLNFLFTHNFKKVCVKVSIKWINYFCNQA